MKCLLKLGYLANHINSVSLFDFYSTNLVHKINQDYFFLSSVHTF